jgi:hypothetical protein
LAIVAILAGCTAGKGGSTGTTTSPTPTPTTPGASPTGVPLSPTDQLVRASMALRGVRPSIGDLQAVEADPAALPGLIDAYLETPEFGETIKDLHNESFLTRWESLPMLLPVMGQMSNWTEAEITRSLSDQPLELVKYVVTNDKPYTDIVTAGYTMADGISAYVWGVPYSGSGPGDWKVTAWNDGRPAAGVLDDSFMFFRFRSTGFNFNRGRANEISKALLCYDFLSNDIVFDGTVDLADPNAVANAVVDNVSCNGCHQSLDPLASFFFGWQGNLNPGQVQSYPWKIYRTQTEGQWAQTNQRAPSYFGAPGNRLDDLGKMIAADDRFSLCTAKRFYGYMAQIPVEQVPLDVAAGLQETFVNSNFNAKQLAKAVVLSPWFQSAYGESDDDANAIVGYKKARPEQLARMMTDLTGFSWQTSIGKFQGKTVGTLDLASDDVFGFRTLAGGIDSYYVTRPTFTFNGTASLFLREYAAEAAGYVVPADFANPNPSTRRLLTMVSPTQSDEASIRAQIASLDLRLYGISVDPSSQDVTDAWTVFSDTLTRTGDVQHAWRTTLTAMLQDVRIAYF